MRQYRYILGGILSWSVAEHITGYQMIEGMAKWSEISLPLFGLSLFLCMVGVVCFYMALFHEHKRCTLKACAPRLLKIVGIYLLAQLMVAVVIGFITWLLGGLTSLSIEQVKTASDTLAVLLQILIRILFVLLLLETLSRKRARSYRVITKVLISCILWTVCQQLLSLVGMGLPERILRTILSGLVTWALWVFLAETIKQEPEQESAGGVRR